MLLDALAQGEEQTKQLESSLDVSATAHHWKDLVQQIQSNFRNAITIAKIIETSAPVQPACPTIKTVLESTVPNIGSMHTENSARVSRNSERREMLNKRNKQPKWTKSVISTPGGEVEALEDGYSWRKYGQKDILGASHPRAYYRCTYRNSVGCTATKKVQRSDENPYIFDVIYSGEHTCRQKSRRVILPDQLTLEIQHSSSTVSHESQVPHQDQLLIPDLQTGLDLEFEGMGIQDQLLGSVAFSFPSAPITKFMPESSIFSPGFISPVNEPDYFSVSLWPDPSETELSRIVSATTSNTSSSVAGKSSMHRYN